MTALARYNDSGVQLVGPYGTELVGSYGVNLVGGDAYGVQLVGAPYGVQLVGLDAVTFDESHRRTVEMIATLASATLGAIAGALVLGSGGRGISAVGAGVGAAGLGFLLTLLTDRLIDFKSSTPLPDETPQTTPTSPA